VILGAGSKVKAHWTSGGRKMPVRHTIPLVLAILCIYYHLAVVNLLRCS